VGYFIEPTILQSTDPKEKILKEVCLIKPIQLSFSFNSLDSSLHFSLFHFVYHLPTKACTKENNPGAKNIKEDYPREIITCAGLAVSFVI